MNLSSWYSSEAGRAWSGLDASTSRHRPSAAQASNFAAELTLLVVRCDTRENHMAAGSGDTQNLVECAGRSVAARSASAPRGAGSPAGGRRAPRRPPRRSPGCTPRTPPCTSVWANSSAWSGHSRAASWRGRRPGDAAARLGAGWWRASCGPTRQRRNARVMHARARAPTAPPRGLGPAPASAKDFSGGEGRFSARPPGHLGEVALDNRRVPAAKNRRLEHLAYVIRFPLGPLAGWIKTPGWRMGVRSVAWTRVLTRRSCRLGSPHRL
jgi:hypothetical protein